MPFTFFNIESLFVVGSSDKEQDCGTPEKLARPGSDRKRKRKGGDEVLAAAKGGPRLIADTKKINDYFVKHPGSSPIRHGGAKSPSPGQQSYSMVSETLPIGYLIQ